MRLVTVSGREFGIRDVFGEPPPNTLPFKCVVFYAVFSRRGYYGAVKFHRKLNCPVLLSWKPDLVLFDGTVWRDYDKEKNVPEEKRCKRCWK